MTESMEMATMFLGWDLGPKEVAASPMQRSIPRGGSNCEEEHSFLPVYQHRAAAQAVPMAL